MKVKFIGPCHFGGVDYGKGVHVLPDDLAGHWFFLACVKNGKIAILEKPKAVIQPKVEESLKLEADLVVEPVEEVKIPKKRGRKPKIKVDKEV